MPDAVLTQLDDERCEADFDVVKQARITPVTLGRKVDDKARGTWSSSKVGILPS
jgi:hypothetical protein